tara:strand:+ start:9967 stop:10290 length:324 start_codon:yes stop_codon:yes gene_type:complete
MVKIQLIGTGMDLSDGPEDMISTAFGGGTVQMTGSESDLSRTTDPMGVFNTGVRGGKVQAENASMVDLDRTPHRGWDSYSTPISENSKNPDGSTSSYPNAGGRRGGR